MVEYQELKNNPEMMSAYVIKKLHAASGERVPLGYLGRWESSIDAVNHQINPTLENLRNVLKLLGFEIRREVSSEEIKKSIFYKRMYDRYKGEFVRFVKSLYSQIELLEIIDDSKRDAIEAACNDITQGYVVNRAVEMAIEELGIGTGARRFVVWENCKDEYIRIYNNRRILSYLCSLQAALIGPWELDADRANSIGKWQGLTKTWIQKLKKEGVQTLHSDMNIYSQLYEFYNFLRRLNGSIASVCTFGNGIGRKMYPRGTSKFKERVGTLKVSEGELSSAVKKLIPKLGALLARLTETLFFVELRSMTLSLAEFQSLTCVALPICSNTGQFLFGVPLSLDDPKYGIKFGNPTVIFVGEHKDLLCFPTPNRLPVLVPDNSVRRLRDGSKIPVIDIQSGVARPARPRFG